MRSGSSTKSARSRYGDALRWTTASSPSTSCAAGRALGPRISGVTAVNRPLSRPAISEAYERRRPPVARRTGARPVRGCRRDSARGASGADVGPGREQPRRVCFPCSAPSAPARACRRCGSFSTSGRPRSSSRPRMATRCFTWRWCPTDRGYIICWGSGRTCARSRTWTGPSLVTLLLPSRPVSGSTSSAFSWLASRGPSSRPTPADRSRCPSRCRGARRIWSSCASSWTGTRRLPFWQQATAARSIPWHVVLSNGTPHLELVRFRVEQHVLTVRLCNAMPGGWLPWQIAAANSAAPLEGVHYRLSKVLESL
jgi:hypothetical protein